MGWSYCEKFFYAGYDPSKKRGRPERTQTEVGGRNATYPEDLA